MTPRNTFALGLLFALSLASGAEAKVASQGPSGFSVALTADVTAEPKAAYDAFLKIGSWWSSDHSFSGDAKNLSIDARSGGCWCEKLPEGGFVRHMEISHVAPGSTLVFAGGLGPLHFMGVDGAMMISFKKADKGTTVTLSYAVGGYDEKGFKDLAVGVDAVLAGQFQRYANFASTGKP
jgi:hypothetical protein